MELELSTYLKLALVLLEILDVSIRLRLLEELSHDSQRSVKYDKYSLLL